MLLRGSKHAVAWSALHALPVLLSAEVHLIWERGVGEVMSRLSGFAVHKVVAAPQKPQLAVRGRLVFAVGCSSCCGRFSMQSPGQISGRLVNYLVHVWVSTCLQNTSQQSTA